MTWALQHSEDSANQGAHSDARSPGERLRPLRWGRARTPFPTRAFPRPWAGGGRCDCSACALTPQKGHRHAPWGAGRFRSTGHAAGPARRNGVERRAAMQNTGSPPIPERALRGRIPPPRPLVGGRSGWMRLSHPSPTASHMKTPHDRTGSSRAQCGGGDGLRRFCAAMRESTSH